MRNILGLVGLVAIATVSAQNFERVEVVKVDSTRSASDLYRMAERWFVDTFKDAQEVIQLRDTASHTLVGKGMGQAIFTYKATAEPWPWFYSVEVQSKDGRYRVKVYDVALTEGGAAYPISDKPCCIAGCDYAPKSKAEQTAKDDAMPGYLSVCEQMRAEVAALLSSLNRAMTKPKDDW